MNKTITTSRTSTTSTTSAPSMTTTRRATSAFTALFVALVLAGCATAPAPLPDNAPPAPESFKEAEGRWARTVPAEAQPRGEWWVVFGDPVLADLVGKAGTANGNIRLAAARLAQARAIARIANADRFPQIGIGAGAQRATANPAFGTTAPATVFNAGASVSYEPDLFGRIAKANDAAVLDAEARDALLQSTKLMVQGDVAQTYYQLRALDAERALVRRTVDTYADTLRLTERRLQIGDVGELDVARIRTEVSATRAAALALDRQRAALEHALAVLIGELPSHFALAEVEWTGAAPRIPPGVPSTVLTRRPDVAAAQRSMLAAQSRVGVAQAAWFPSVSLTAQGGLASTDLGDLFKWSARSWGIGALLSLPLFDGGRRDAGVQNAKAELDAAAATYRDQVLVAFRDVEDELSALRLLDEQAGAEADAVTSATRATQLSGSRYRNGSASQLDLLDAQRSELANRRTALQVRSAQFQATIGLIRALGGSWNAPMAGLAGVPVAAR